MNIQEVTFEGKKYLTLKKNIATSQISDKEMYDTGFRRLFEYVGSHQIQVNGKPVVIYFKWDEANGQAEIGLGVPVTAVDSVTEVDFSLVDIPSSKASLGVLKGNYSGLKQIHMDLGAYAKEHNIKQDGLAIEEYVSDPMSDPNPDNWITNVYYLHS